MAEQKPRKRVKDLKVHEISFVDNPAVPKARFLIVKRHEEGGDTVNLEGKDNPGDEKDVAAIVAKEAGEELTKQQIKAMEAARTMITALMGKRGDLPPFFRRQVMEMDIAIDEFMRERNALLRRADPDEGNGAEGEEAPQAKAEATPEVKSEEATEEKARKIPEVKSEEATEEKAGHTDEDEEGKEKAGHKPNKQKCPPFMVFDEESGKCVPKKKEKGEKSEKVEETEDEKSAPRDGGGGDALKEASTLELSAAQKKRVDKLIQKYEASKEK